jgi:hypothetical protein
MAQTPQHNMRIPLELWALIEEAARARETFGSPRFPRSWIVCEALKQYFGLELQEDEPSP